MKQSQVNKFFTNLAGHQLISNVTSPTTSARSKHNKNVSSTISNGNKYLVYSKSTSRHFVDSKKKLPILTTVMKTETQDTPKTALVKLRKASGNSGDFRFINQHQRNKTETLTILNNINITKVESPKEQIQEAQQITPFQSIYHTVSIPKLIEQQNEIYQVSLTSNRSEDVTYQIKPKVQHVQVLGETCEFTKRPKIYPKFNKIKIFSHITEIESLNEKSCHLMRKLRQMLHTHREKEQLLELETKRNKESIIDRQFSKTLSNMPDEKTPKSIETKLNFKLSTITKKQTKISPNHSIQDTESILPIKTIIDALKEKKDDKKVKTKNQQSQTIQQIQKKIIKVTIAFEENEKQIEFETPGYINKASQIQDQQVEFKENKQSNIYSLVSKSMLQNKFALKLVKKFGDKVIQTQKDNDAIENFNSFKASQFTKYYLQNHAQKCLKIKYEPQQEEDEIKFVQKLNFLNKNCYSETFLEMQSKSTQQIALLNRNQYKKQYEIESLFYSVEQNYEGHHSDNSILSPNTTQIDQCEIEAQTQFKIKYIYQMLNLISTNDINLLKQRVIVNTIDDETKNQLLHKDLLKFPEIINLVIEVQNDSENYQLKLINDLEQELLRLDLNNIKIKFSNQYHQILTGLFEDYRIHQASQMEKIYIDYCKTLKDLDSVKNYDRQLINLSIPQISRSRLASPIGSNESKQTGNDINPLFPKRMILKKTQKQKNLLATQKYASAQNIKFQSSRNLQALLHANTNSNQNIYQLQSSQRIQQKEFEQQTKSKSSQRQTSITPNLITQQSMDPFSLLFRSMLLQESQQYDKSNIERAFSLIEDHRLQDLKDLLNHDQNININCQDQNGNTFLIQASRTGAHDIIQFLLRQGAEVSTKNNDGLNAIQIAIIHLQFEAADEINKFSRQNSFISH